MYYIYFWPSLLQPTQSFGFFPIIGLVEANVVFIKYCTKLFYALCFRLMMVPKGVNIDIAIFIFINLTDFVTFNKFCVLNEKLARNCQILAHNNSGSDSLSYKISCVYWC